MKRIPTLLVWGDRDGTVSLSSATKLKRRLRGAELVVVPGGGHWVFGETPAESNRIVLEWLGRHPVSTPRVGAVPSCLSCQKDEGALPLCGGYRLGVSWGSFTSWGMCYRASLRARGR